MQGKKEARQMWKSGRASVENDNGSIPQAEWERGCRAVALAFALMAVAYVAWEVLL